MIEIKNLDFYYKKNRLVLKDINLSILEGRIVGVLGKNGVGKTTLLHLISGLLFPRSGSIVIDGRMPQNRQTALLQEVFLLPEEMPETNLRIDQFEKINSVFYPKFSKEQFHTYLSEFEITDTKQHIGKLSLGTKKKVFIAFALACNTKYLLMDEPTNGLDIPTKSCLRKMLRKSMSEDKLVMISTHQARDLQNILDSIIIIDQTSILLDKNSEEITQKLYFGIETGEEKPEEILYKEPSIAGNQIVRLNTEGEESNLDVELLFNAAFESKDLFKQIFNK